MVERNRPIVILAGWLGCHPKNLQRHVQMYDRMGYSSLIRIGSPDSVVNAMVHGPPSIHTEIGDTLDNVNGHHNSSELKLFAFSTLQHIQQLKPNHFIIHVFSNNGCFFWEWIRYMLYHQSSYNLQYKLIGIIFDSAPAYYFGKIDGLLSALEYVGDKVYRDEMITAAKAIDPNRVKRRHKEFWDSLRCDEDASSNIPQLYLYSDCDELASVKHLEKLIAYRQQLTDRKERIHRCKFVGSSHCGHLKKHPTLYENAVQNFLEYCTSVDGCKRCRL